jgi:CRISPR-associated protein Cas5d
MGYGITVRVQGDYALFTRPEMKVERVSYEIITPSAARGLIEAIYWKPAIRWVIDKIHVLNEIEFTNVRRNEVSEKISTREAERRMRGATAPFYLDAVDARQQRAAMVLKNVDYVIEAHFELVPEQGGPDETEEKHYNIALRRLRKGQYYHAPYLGTREFSARVELIEDGSIPQSVLTGVRDLGWMLYDLDFHNAQDIQPQFFKAILRDGILDLTNVEVKQ